MTDIFGEGGILARIHASFELRDEQARMADFMLETLADRKYGLVEAGTGVGKTLAYLIPSLLYCLENGKKLAVSTETKALQKQLLDKDIPLAREVISLHSGKSFTASLCLGSGNYPCRRRYEMLLAQGRFGPHQMRDIEAIGELFRNKSAFTRFDLRVSQELWGKIMRDPEVCHFHSCPFSSNCVFQQARRQWARSDLLVINHYLFFSNLRSGKSYLPAFDAVIFDEAHSLEEIASDQMGFSAGREDVKNVLEGLYRKGRKSGVFQAIEEPARRRKAGDLVKKTAAESETFFESLRRRIPPEKVSTRLRESLLEGRGLLQSLKEVYRAMAEIDTLIEDEYRKMEYDILRSRLFELIENLSLVIYGENEEYVFWIEGAEDQLLGDLRLRGQPVEVAEIFAREVLGNYESTVGVSATLTVNGDFSYSAGRLGMESPRTLRLMSPFDYRGSVVLMVSRHIPGPGTPAYLDESAGIAARVIDHVKGNCLMLFTSYSMMAEIRKRLEGKVDYPLISQGEVTAAEAMERYLAKGNAILMGTHSFWQGIDLPGDLLRGVIMMRLPFSVPDRPPVEARMERVERKGMNAFYGYQIPGAVIRFRQGFGRLIRGKSDRGIVAVLDSRVLTKSYGKLFLSSIPECTMAYGVDELLPAFDALRRE